MKKDDLVYDLIFSDKLEYEIDIFQFVDNIYQYDKFIDEIKYIFRKSKVMVLSDKLHIESKKAIWTLKVKK